MDRGGDFFPLSKRGFGGKGSPFLFGGWKESPEGGWGPPQRAPGAHGGERATRAGARGAQKIPGRSPRGAGGGVPNHSHIPCGPHRCFWGGLNPPNNTRRERRGPTTPFGAPTKRGGLKKGAFSPGGGKKKTPPRGGYERESQGPPNTRGGNQTRGREEAPGVPRALFGRELKKSSRRGGKKSPPPRGDTPRCVLAAAAGQNIPRGGKS